MIIIVYTQDLFIPTFFFDISLVYYIWFYPNFIMAFPAIILLKIIIL